MTAPALVAWVTGVRGQVGRALAATVPAGWSMVGASTPELDITDPAAVARSLAASQATLVVNCAAFTAVDRAETEPESAQRVNGDGAGVVARAARAAGVRLIQLSTDFVFDGAKGTPYKPGDAPNPLSVYGRTKLDGERQVLASMSEALILRTAWVYAAQGKNFVLTMLRLLGERREVRVVEDQVGTPTWATGLAGAIWRAAGLPRLTGIHHWTDAGVASWYDLAVAIREEALGMGILSDAARVEPIPASAYPLPAQRPAFSVLDKTATWDVLGTPPHWREQLRTMLREYRDA